MVKQRGEIELNVKTQGVERLRRLDRDVSSMKSRFGDLGASMLKADLAGRALSAVFSRLSGSIKSTLTDALNWEDWVGSNTRSLDLMSASIDGMISKLELSRTQTKLTSGDFKATEFQLRAVSKAAIFLARQNKADLAPSLRQVTDAVTGGRTRALKDLGINIDVIGSAANKTAVIMRELEKRFGDVDVSASNMNEELAKAKTSFGDAVAELGSSLVTIVRTSSAFQGLADSISSSSRNLRGMFGLLRGNSREFRKFIEYLESVGTSGFLGFFQPAEVKQKIRESIASARTASMMALSSEEGHGGGSGGPGGGTFGRGRSKSKKSKKGGLDELLSGARDSRPSLGLSDFGFGDDAEAQAKRDELMRLIGGAGGGPGGGTVGVSDTASVQVDQIQGLNLDDFGISEQMAANADQTERATEAMNAWNETMQASSETMAGMATDALRGLAAGMWSVIDAAVSGQMSFGRAMALMTKQVLMGVAQRSAVRAVEEFAEGLSKLGLLWGSPSPGAAAHFASAAAFTAISAGTGLTAIGIGSMAAGGNNPSKSRDRSGRSSRISGPGGGEGRREGDKTIQPTINVYLSPQNAATEIAWKKKLNALVEAA